MILYKYLDPERIDVLQNGLVRFTQPGAFNDPFEVKPYINKISQANRIEQTIDNILPEEVARIYEELPLEVKITISYESVLEIAQSRRQALRGQFTNIVNTFTPLLRNTMEVKFNELIGIFSLTEKPNNLLMWSHYARAHEGLVLGFDSAHEYFDQRKAKTDEFKHLRKVEYRLNRPNAPLADLGGVDVFLVKSKEWEYEQEWRIMRPLADAFRVIPDEPYKIYLYQYPLEAVAEVILGSRMNEVSINVITALLNERKEFSNVSLKQAVPSENQFKIEIRDMKSKSN